MKTEIHLRKYFYFHEHSFWLLTDRLIAILPICAVPHVGLKLELQSNKYCNIYSAGTFWTDGFNIFQYSLSFLEWFKEKKKENIKKLILFVFFISHATTQNWIWQKCLSIMIVPCNCCLSLELSVSAALAHTFWTLAEFTDFFVLISQTNTKHSTPSTAGYCHNCREADCFQATPTLLTIPQYVCITLRYKPFPLNTVSPFPLPHAVQILDELHKRQ